MYTVTNLDHFVKIIQNIETDNNDIMACSNMVNLINVKITGYYKDIQHFK